MPGLLDRLRLPALSDRGRVVVTVVLAIVAIAAQAANSISLAVTSRSTPVDYATFGPPGKLIQAGPFELIFWGIPNALGVSGAAGWATVGIIGGSLGLLLFAILTERALRSVSREWSVPLATAIAALAALISVPAQVISDGHPAQLAIPLLWLAAALAARAGRPLTAAILLGLTAGWELWGLLGVPVLLLAPRLDWRWLWRSALGVVAIGAVLFVPFIVLGPFRMFEFAWTTKPGTLPALLFPGTTSFPWSLRLAQGVLSIGSGVVIARTLRSSVHAIWLAPLAVCAVRLFFDPLLSGYYTVPPTLLALVGLFITAAQRRFLSALACLVVVNALVDLQPLNVAKVAAIVVLMAITFVLVRRSESPRQELVGVAHPSGPLS
jgi:hypothetical protein